MPVTPSKKPAISAVLIFRIAIAAILAFVIMGAVVITYEYADFKSETEAIRARNIESKKNHLKDLVGSVSSYIKFKRESTDERLKKTVKAEVYRAHATATNIYEKFKDNKSKEEIRDLIKEAIRPTSFNDSRGYVYIIQLDYMNVLFPTMPHLEGKSTEN